MKEFKYEKVYQSIVSDINDGYLHYQEKLPSVRKMAEKRGVSRTTVENAYVQLLNEGYIYSKEKVGYFVRIQDPVSNQLTLNRKSMLTEVKYDYDLSGQKVDDESFNIEVWKRYIKKALKYSDELTCYGNHSGEEILKIQLQNYCQNNRGVKRPIDSYVIGAGFQVLLYYVCALFDDDITVGVDESGFVQGEAVFHDCHMHIVKLKSDHEGIIIDELKRNHVNLIYVNSSSGGYHGHPIKQQRRNELIKYAHDYNAYIIEDDHNGELMFNSKPIDAMAKFDNQRIFYIGSFSKLLLPSIRMSYLALPIPFLEQFKIKMKYYHPTASKLEQLALALYIEDGQLSRHLKRLRKHYYVKSNKMLELLKDSFPQHHFELYETSLMITMSVDQDKIDSYIDLAKENHILVAKNSYHQIALSISGMILEDIEKAILLLKRIWK